MPNSAAIEIELMDNGSIALTIDVRFEAGATVVLSGSATQQPPNGPVATFNETQILPAPLEPGGGSLVTVSPILSPSSPKFVAAEPITVTVNAATTWQTVLSEDPTDQRPEVEAVLKA